MEVKTSNDKLTSPDEEKSMSESGWETESEAELGEDLLNLDHN